MIDVGTNSVKFHVGERGADGAWRTVVDRAEVTRLGEGLDATGRLGRGADRSGRPTAIAGMVDEARQDGVAAIAAVGTAGMRIAANAPTFVDAVRERTRRRDRGDPGRGGGAPRLSSRPSPGSAVARRLARRLRHGRRQLAVHVRRTATGSTSGSASTSARSASPSGSGSTTRSRTTTLAEALAAIAADLARLDGRPAPDALVGMGGAVTNLAAVKHGLADVRPRRRAGHGARPRRDRPADRALPHARRRRAPRRSSACSPSAPT